MDYVVGSVAALVTGNVTPSRPRILKRALTPTKHQQSPNVTPRSEVMNDRSIFLSPSLQKKKAIVKKSPKRIFQNPDLDTTEDGEGNSNLLSPKADKVKKHLKDDLDSEVAGKTNSKSPSQSPLDANITVEQRSNECTPKKKKNKRHSVTAHVETPSTETSETPAMEVNGSKTKTSKKKKNLHKLVNNKEDNIENGNDEMEHEPLVAENRISIPESVTINQEKVVETSSPKKKNKKRKKKSKQIVETKVESAVELANEKTEPTQNNAENGDKNQSKTKKKNRKRKKSKLQQPQQDAAETSDAVSENNDEDEPKIKSKKSKLTVNPNAITDKESDSEHESDNEIESENEGINEKVFESQTAEDESSDDEEETKVVEKESKKEKVKKKEVKEKIGEGEINVEEEIKKTLFVGNVPFSTKCKKEVKKIFSKHGRIETIRIRTVPVKDGRYTPKLAVIKNELHPERTTVNIYIKYAEEESVEKALVENNTVMNDHHLRVSRSSQTGVEHDPKCSIFLGNLPFAMEDEALRQKFENCGQIESVRIIRDKKTNAGKGFGYVNFASKDGVELALALTEEDLTIKNRIIRVKRCTQTTHKQKQTVDKGGFKKSFNQRPNAGNQRPNTGNQRPGNQRPNTGNQRPNAGNQRPNAGNQRQNSGYQRQNFGNQRVQTGPRQSNNQGGYRGGPKGPKNEVGQDGAHRRLMHKRKSQENGDGPPNKRQKDSSQPREKKTKKEFVGMTAEKKKKRKFDKGQKKKKNLSEILTK